MPKKGGRKQSGKKGWRRRLKDDAAVEAVARLHNDKLMATQSSASLFAIDRSKRSDKPISREKLKEEKKSSVLFREAMLSGLAAPGAYTDKRVRTLKRRHRFSDDYHASQRAKRMKVREEEEEVAAAERSGREPSGGTAFYDIWGDDAPVSKRKAKLLAVKDEIARPGKIAPIEAGISYNPDRKEHKKVLRSRRRHVELEERAKRREKLAKATPDMAAERGVFVDAPDSEEDFSSEDETLPEANAKKLTGDKLRLSRTDRNRLQRERMQRYLDHKARAQAKKKRALAALPKALEEVEKSLEGKEERDRARLERRRVTRDQKLRIGSDRRDPQLQPFVLEDEMPGNLRNVAHPFGSTAPMRDMMRKLEDRRVIETRLKKKKKRVRKKVIETESGKSFESQFV